MRFFCVNNQIIVAAPDGLLYIVCTREGDRPPEPAREKMKQRVTKKFVKQNVSLYRDALPGSLTSYINFSKTDAMIFADGDYGIETMTTLVLRRFEKWGWIEYRGCPILTVLGYKSI